MTNLAELAERIDSEYDIDDTAALSLASTVNDTEWDDDDDDLAVETEWPFDHDDDDEEDFSLEYDDEFDDRVFADEVEYETPGALYRDGFRLAADPALADIAEDEIDERLQYIMTDLSPSEEFNFGSALGSLGDAGKKILGSDVVSDIGRTVLPTAGAAVGTMYGGPMGTAIGAQLGQAASGALFSEPKKPKPKPRPVPQSPSPPVQAPVNMSPPAALPPVSSAQHVPAQDGSTAAIRLINMLDEPHMRQALVSYALGENGNAVVTIPGTGEQIPAASFVKLLRTLVDKIEAVLDSKPVGNVSYDHLKNEDGEFVFDPTADEQRAEGLYQFLRSLADERVHQM